MPLQWSCDGTVAGVPFTRQGSQVRTLYHPPVKSSTYSTFGCCFCLVWEKYGKTTPSYLSGLRAKAVLAPPER
jgi:hypothetical protein